MACMANCCVQCPLREHCDEMLFISLLQLLASLDHPNIIGYKESFIDQKDGALCIVTSFCEVRLPGFGCTAPC